MFSWLWPQSQAHKSINIARPGSVLNITRKQSSPNYKKAKNTGLSNTNAMNYTSKMNVWRRGMPKYSPGQHPNNRAANNAAWESSNPKPLLPGESMDPQQAAYNTSRLASRNYYGGRRSRKHRKSRR